jgi:hypothetical protein
MERKIKSIYKFSMKHPNVKEIIKGKSYNKSGIYCIENTISNKTFLQRRKDLPYQR